MRKLLGFAIAVSALVLGACAPPPAPYYPPPSGPVNPPADCYFVPTGSPNPGQDVYYNGTPNEAGNTNVLSSVEGACDGSVLFAATLAVAEDPGTAQDICDTLVPGSTATPPPADIQGLTNPTPDMSDAYICFIVVGP